MLTAATCSPFTNPDSWFPACANVALSCAPFRGSTPAMWSPVCTAFSDEKVFSADALRMERMLRSDGDVGLAPPLPPAPAPAPAPDAGAGWPLRPPCAVISWLPAGTGGGTARFSGLGVDTAPEALPPLR